MKFQDLYIGQEYTMSKKFTEQEVADFAQLSTDYNPVHLDKEYAAQTIFKKNIVHGFLTGSLFSAIIGTRMPGEGSVYLKQDMKFMSPVYIGEEVTASVKIKELKEAKHIVVLETMLFKPDKETAIEGEAVIKFLN